MLALKGIYDKGKITLPREPRVTHPVEVIVTFLEEDVTEMQPRKVQLETFSFAKSRKLLKGYRGSLSDAVIEERRSEL